MSEEEEVVWGLPEKTPRVLQAAAVEAYGRPGVYVTREQVMKRVNIPNLAEFLAIAEHLHRRGWIDEAEPARLQYLRPHP